MSITSVPADVVTALAAVPDLAEAVRLLARERWLIGAVKVQSRHKQATLDFTLILRMGEERGAHGELVLEVPAASTGKQAQSKPLISPSALP